MSVKTTELLNELFETLKIIENCASCKYKEIYGNDLYKFYESMNGIENCSAKLEKEEQDKLRIVDKLNHELSETSIRLNKEILCEGFKEGIGKLTHKWENEKIAKFLHCANKHYSEIKWIPFDEFKNIEYLTKGGFGEIYKATCTNLHYNDVVLKRLYNSSDNILDILKEVK